MNEDRGSCAEVRGEEETKMGTVWSILTEPSVLAAVNLINSSYLLSGSNYGLAAFAFGMFIFCCVNLICQTIKESSSK